MKNTLILFLALTTSVGVRAQNFESYKTTGTLPPSSQSMIYALPQSNIMITVEVAKTTIRKGVYAEYAEKYLSLHDVPMKDSQTWSISNVKVYSQMEADPSQLYVVTFKTFPERLHSLFSVSRNGVVLDFANTWKRTMLKHAPGDQQIDPVEDPNLLEETTKEKVDTFYKTVMTDSTFVRIPVFKKQIQAKTKEEIIKETANQLIKTRRHKIKILRGEYDFHPDGEALKVMVDELSKYEETLLSLFAGVKTVEKERFVFMFIPQTDIMTKELCYFNPEKGILDQKEPGSSAISIQLTKEQDPIKITLPEKTKNTLYVRAPVMVTAAVKTGDKKISSSRIPIYQFGPVMVMPLE
jgi:hypothetical protein